MHWSGLLLYVRVLTSTDDKDDNDITEPERDDDRLFDKIFKDFLVKDIMKFFKFSG